MSADGFGGRFVIRAFLALPRPSTLCLQHFLQDVFRWHLLIGRW